MTSTTRHLGTWLSIGSPVVAELAALVGFDWLLFDLEHGCAPEAMLPDQLRAVGQNTTQCVVRVGAPHADLIARVLDWGADGIMVPHVESAAAAASIVDAASHAPTGSRGFSRTVRATGYGLSAHSGKPLLMAQIESRRGVAAAREIAAVEGIDVLFVGPSDLRHDLSCHADSEPNEFDHCLSEVVQAARSAGKAAGILLRDTSALQAHREAGFTYIAIESDLSILRNAYQSILK